MKLKSAILIKNCVTSFTWVVFDKMGGFRSYLLIVLVYICEYAVLLSIHFTKILIIRGFLEGYS